MVTTLNITLDDDVADHARDVKEVRGLTWPEFIEVAAEALEGQDQSRTSNLRRPTPDIRDPDPVFEQPEPEPEPEPDHDLDLEGIDIDVPGSGDVEQRRIETIIEMAQLLRDRGTAEKSDFLEVVDTDVVDYASDESFWANCVKGRESLKAIPGVEPPPTGRTEWTWTEDTE